MAIGQQSDHQLLDHVFLSNDDFVGLLLDLFNKCTLDVNLLIERFDINCDLCHDVHLIPESRGTSPT